LSEGGLQPEIDGILQPAAKRSKILEIPEKNRLFGRLN
jgi:hypothetical protein